MRRFFGFIIFSMTIFGFLSVGFMYFKQENMIFSPDTLQPDFKFAIQQPYEELTWPVQGARMHALHVKADKPRGVVLFLHGNMGSLKSWAEAAPDFTSRGYDVVMPDYRGFGKSTGEIENEKMLLDDAQTAYDYVKTKFPEDRIVLYGRSIGSAFAVHLARTNRPRLVILEAPFFSLFDMAARYYQILPRAILGLLVRYPLRTDLWISDVAAPVSIIHGTRDRVIPFNDSERLLPLIRSQRQLIAIQGGDHNNLADFREYRDALDRLLR